MHPVPCTNTRHDATDLINHSMVKNAKAWTSRELFYETKIFLTYASDSLFWEVIVL